MFMKSKERIPKNIFFVSLFLFIIETKTFFNVKNKDLFTEKSRCMTKSEQLFIDLKNKNLDEEKKKDLQEIINNVEDFIKERKKTKGMSVEKNEKEIKWVKRIDENGFMDIEIAEKVVLLNNASKLIMKCNFGNVELLFIKCDEKEQIEWMEEIDEHFFIKTGNVEEVLLLKYASRLITKFFFENIKKIEILCNDHDQVEWIKVFEIRKLNEQQNIAKLFLEIGYDKIVYKIEEGKTPVFEWNKSCF